MGSYQQVHPDKGFFFPNFKKFYGGVPIETLAWSLNEQDGKGEARLFVAGFQGFIQEFQVDTMSIKQKYDVGVSVWSLSCSKDGKYLAAGCEDGLVRLFSLEAGELAFLKASSRLKGRIVSVSWSPSSSLIACGTAEGVLCLVSFETGRIVKTMSVESLKTNPTVVWCTSFIDEQTLVSGDSCGMVNFWDCKVGISSFSFKSHAADVLCLTHHGDVVFASGIDHKIVQFKLLGESQKWVLVNHSRAHTHDVRAISFCPHPTFPYIVSGGVDTNMVVTDPEKFPKHHEKRISAYPTKSIIKVCKSKRIIMSILDNSIKVWQLGKSETDEGMDKLSNGFELSVAKSYKLLMQLDFPSHGNIVCAEISSNGKWIIVSTSSAMKIFELSVINGILTAKPFKSTLEEFTLYPAGNIQFIAETDKFVYSALFKPKIYVVDLETQTIAKIKVASKNKNTSLLTLSSDGQFLASCSFFNIISIYSLDSLELYYQLPQQSSIVTACAFQPRTNNLVIACNDNRVQIYDVENMRLHDWSLKFNQALPEKLLLREEKIIGISFHPKNLNVMIFWCLDGFLKLNAAKGKMNFEEIATMAVKRSNGGKLKKPSSRAANSMFSFHPQYRQLLQFDFISDKELIAVERPWISVLEKLPASFFKKQYAS